MFGADVAARTPLLYLQWDEQRRVPERTQYVDQLEAWLNPYLKRPERPPLPLGSPANLEHVSYPYWEFMVRSQFVPIRHAEDPSRTLYLRRDLQEAYVVCLADGTFHSEGQLGSKRHLNHTRVLLQKGM